MGEGASAIKGSISPDARSYGAVSALGELAGELARRGGEPGVTERATQLGGRHGVQLDQHPGVPVEVGGS